MPLDVLALAMLPYRVGGRRAFQYGGALVEQTLLGGLAAAGHRVRAIAEWRDDGFPRSGTPIPGVDVDWFAVEYVSGREPPSRTAIARCRDALDGALGRMLRGGRPDVVLLGREAQAWYGTEVFREAGIPTVAMAHCNATAGLAQGMYAPDVEAEFIRCLGAADRVVTVSAHLGAALRARGIEAVTIPNAVDGALFRPGPPDPLLRARIGVADGAPMVVYISGLMPGKRWGDLIASAARVARAVPGVRYVVAGAEDDLCEAQRTAREEGVEDVFRWLGVLDRAAVPSLLRAADVMVHTSEREAAPLTYLESLACGTAIVATDIPAARDVIEDGRTGVLYPVGDVEALTAKTIALLRDAPRRAALGSAARETRPGGDPAEWAARYAEVLTSAAAMAAAVG